MWSLASRIVVVLLFCKIVLDQIRAVREPRIATLFAFLGALTLVNVAYETGEMGCSLFDCSIQKNRSALQDTSEQRLCREGNRVNWRRAFLFAFCIFIVLNIVYSEDTLKNVAVMLCTFTFLYFYLNFDAYHRFSIWCR